MGGVGKLGVEGSGGELGCGREGKVDASNPILHYALGLTIEIQDEVCLPSGRYTKKFVT